jgi:hypothetical protein
MKLVINKCYGGFSLSPLAVKRMAELRGEECFFFKEKSRKYTPITIEKAQKEFLWTAFKVKNPTDYFSYENFHSLSIEDKVKLNQSYSKVNLTCRPENRSDPLLVQTVEELGEKANGSCAELKIIEIPDGIEWEINEYDGMESVRECHRSWS